MGYRPESFTTYQMTYKSIPNQTYRTETPKLGNSTPHPKFSRELHVTTRRVLFRRDEVPKDIDISVYWVSIS